jgi:hypothetical protein
LLAFTKQNTGSNAEQNKTSNNWKHQSSF